MRSKYLDEAEKIAYEIGLRPWEFRRMTPAEFSKVVAGYERRMEQQWEMAAWIVSHVYGPHLRKGKKRPTVDKLLGRKPKAQD